jgi:hypothetical protein
MNLKGRKAGLAFVVCCALALGVMTVTPAGAAVGTNWSKIWKKYIRPKADKRYYTKATTDAKVAAAQAAATSAGAAAGAAASNAATDAKLGQYYKKTESDAKYAALGSSYTKAESDGRYAPYPTVMRGVYTMSLNGVAGVYMSGASISFDYVLPAAPIVHYIPPAGVPPAQCPGTAQRPDAIPGHLCVYGTVASNVANFAITNRSGAIGTAEPYGAGLHAQATANGVVQAYGTWAVRPGSVSTNPPAIASSSSGAATTVR